MRTTIVTLSFLLVGCASGEAAKRSYVADGYPSAQSGYRGGPQAETVAMEPAEDAGGGLLSVFDAMGGDAAPGGPMPAPPPSRPAPAPDAEPEPSEPKSAPADAPPSGKRLVIYTGRVALMVASVEPAMEKLLARTTELGGYLSQRTDQTIVVRVPAEHFHTLVEEAAAMGTVLQRELRAQDVTAEYRDLVIRIENAERSRKRLLELLERAEEMEDILKIEAELTRITGELESMKGRLRLLADQISLSTLTIELRSNAPPPRPVHLRRYSRFEWINRVGVENVTNNF